MTSAGCLQQVEEEGAEGRDTGPSHTLPVNKNTNTEKKSDLETFSFYV